MKIRYYSTDVEVNQTAQELQEKLAQSEAHRVSLDYDSDGVVSAVTFLIEEAGRMMRFRLETNVDGMLQALKKADTPALTKGEVNREQANRVAWRNLKGWVEAQLSMMAAHQARLSKLLLGYGVTSDGSTVHERLVSDRELLEPPADNRR